MNTLASKLVPTFSWNIGKLLYNSLFFQRPVVQQSLVTCCFCFINLLDIKNREIIIKLKMMMVNSEQYGCGNALTAHKKTTNVSSFYFFRHVFFYEEMICFQQFFFWVQKCFSKVEFTALNWIFFGLRIFVSNSFSFRYRSIFKSTFYFFKTFSFRYRIHFQKFLLLL